MSAEPFHRDGDMAAQLVDAARGALNDHGLSVARPDIAERFGSVRSARRSGGMAEESGQQRLHVVRDGDGVVGLVELELDGDEKADVARDAHVDPDSLGFKVSYWFDRERYGGARAPGLYVARLAIAVAQHDQLTDGSPWAIVSSAPNDPCREFPEAGMRQRGALLQRRLAPRGVTFAMHAAEGRIGLIRNPDSPRVHVRTVDDPMPALTARR